MPLLVSLHCGANCQSLETRLRGLEYIHQSTEQKLKRSLQAKRVQCFSYRENSNCPCSMRAAIMNGFFSCAYIGGSPLHFCEINYSLSKASSLPQGRKMPITTIFLARVSSHVLILYGMCPYSFKMPTICRHCAPSRHARVSFRFLRTAGRKMTVASGFPSSSCVSRGQADISNTRVFRVLLGGDSRKVEMAAY